MKIVIIGGVAGGATAAARLRRIDEQAEIILFEKGEYISYANCGLPYHIGGEISNRDSLFLQTPESFNARFNVDIRIGSEVTGISLQQKCVSVKNLKDGTTYDESFDKLLLSTGAVPFIPPTEGIHSESILNLRNVSDMDRILSYIKEKKPQKATVIGGGFIGLEMVENLHSLGLDITLIEKAPQVMTPIDYPMAAIVHKHLTDKGIKLMLGKSVTRFSTDDKHIVMSLDSNESMETDMVIVSIGVRPDVGLAKAAGLEMGSLGGVKVNKFMQTSHPDVYAVGDAVEVFNPITRQMALIPLAGPANKQARIAADNMVGGDHYTYNGSIGTAIAKVFDLTVASAGVSENVLQRFGIDYLTSFTHGSSHAGYYPESMPLSIKINFGPADGKLLGAQVIGVDGADKRIELFAQVIETGGTIYDLQQIEHAYAPPYSSAKDPVNIAGFVAENILNKQMSIIHWNEVADLQRDKDTLLVDVRTSGEYELGHIEGAVNIPVDDLRNRYNELDTNKKIIIYCAVGLRGYIACRILTQKGFEKVYNLSGGYKTYSAATAPITNDNQTPNITNNTDKSQANEMQTPTLTLNACGLQCPGPVRLLKEHYDRLSNGDSLSIKVTDSAFGSDIKGWCNMTGAELISVTDEKGVISACIRKPLEKEKATTSFNSQTEKNKTLVVFSDDLDRVLASFIIAIGAASTGKKVSMFFTFWGLNVLKKQQKPSTQKDLIGKIIGLKMPSNSRKLKLSQMNMAGIGSKMMRAVMKNKRIDSLEDLIAQAQDAGIEFIACSMSMEVMGIGKEELFDTVKVGGVATYLDRTETANLNLFI